MAAALAAVIARLEGSGVEWAVAGSAARALCGFAVRPRDLDLEVGAAGGPVAAARLGISLASAESGGVASRRGRAHLAGVEVDLSAGLRIAGVAPAGLPAISEEVAVGRGVVRVVTPEEQMARAVLTADEARAQRIQREAPPGWALDYLLLERRAAISEPAR